MSKQSDINAKMRTILINWLVEVHRKFRLKPETLFLTVNVLDRFLEKKAVSRSKLQLVGVGLHFPPSFLSYGLTVLFWWSGALLIAAKYEEIYAPEVHELVEMTDNAYSRDEVLQVECIMLNALVFELAVPTPYFFGQRFVLVRFGQRLVSIVSVCELCCVGQASENSEELQHLTLFLLELCLLDYKMLKWLPSVTAASAVFLARRMLGMPIWV